MCHACLSNISWRPNDFLWFEHDPESRLLSQLFWSEKVCVVAIVCLNVSPLELCKEAGWVIELNHPFVCAGFNSITICVCIQWKYFCWMLCSSNCRSRPYTTPRPSTGYHLWIEEGRNRLPDIVNFSSFTYFYNQMSLDYIYLSIAFTGLLFATGTSMRECCRGEWQVGHTYIRVCDG